MNEIEIFKETLKDTWKYGYYEGDPLKENDLAISYNKIKYKGSTAALINGKSSFHQIYLNCIKPYINQHTNAIEIGPGRGAWTKCMIPANSIYVMDALSAEYNHFWQYVGQEHTNIKYLQVKDFECSDLPDNFFTYLFSFGTLCHVSFDGMSQYAKSLYNKLLPGANCFWMIADYKKFVEATGAEINTTISDWDGKWRGWYFANIDRTCEMLSDIGYKIISSDVNLNIRDPIIHFQK